MSAPESLAGFRLLERLSNAQVQTLAQAAHEVSFPDAQVIFREGSPARGCWLLRTGEVALTAAAPGAAPVVLQTLGPGDVLGWSWLTEPAQWLFTATARGAVTAIELDTDRVRAAAEADPGLGYALTQGLLDAALSRLQSTRARLLDMYRSPRER